MESLVFLPFLPIPTVNQLSPPTNSCRDDDAHPLDDMPTLPASLTNMDQEHLASSSAPPASKKRRAIVDADLVGNLLSDVHEYGWRPLHDHHLNLYLPGFSQQLIDGGWLDDDIDNDISYPGSAMAVTTDYYQPDELGDVLNFLWMDDEMASKTLESAASSSSSVNGDVSCAALSHPVNTENETRGKSNDHIGISWQSKKGQLEAMATNEKKILQGRGSWHGLDSRGSWQASSATRSCRDGDVPAFTRAVCAGPTLMDIESALAKSPAPEIACTKTHSPPSLVSPSFFDMKEILAPSSASPNAASLVSSFLDIKNVLAEELSADTKELPNQPDSMAPSWRLKLQKRNSLEPKHTVKVESEDKALNDGYRWRKYGQKTIKNSPFPRSYYRCTTGKCNAKKQVEKSQEHESFVLVTYEGMHLHHRPNILKRMHVATSNLREQEKHLNNLSSPTSSTATSCLSPSSLISSPSSLSNGLILSQ